MSSFAVLCSGQGGQAPDLFERFPFAEKGRSVKQQIFGQRISFTRGY